MTHPSFTYQERWDATFLRELLEVKFRHREKVFFFAKMDECLGSFTNAEVIPRLHAKSGHWQIVVIKEDSEKKNLTSHHGLYRFVIIPCSLKNAFATFQRLMDGVLSTIKCQYVLVDLHDKFIFCKTSKEYFERTKSVLRLLQDVGITPKLINSISFTNQIDCLGHGIKPGKIKLENHAANAI